MSAALSRVPEPELMDAAEQVDAYAAADFSESHDRVIAQIAEAFPGFSFEGTVLNLGCGHGDDAFRFLRRFPKSRVVAVDGSARMITRASLELQMNHKELSGRIEFLTAYIPSRAIPQQAYCAVVSNSLLHHFHEPSQFWKAIGEYAPHGAGVFVADLRRPQSKADLERLVSFYAADAPDILREDFRNSLGAAFTLQEVNDQLRVSELRSLTVREIGDRHLIVSGFR